MWQWEFWQQFLDTMVRNRYNVLTLWTTHPYPGIVKLPEYPEANYDDVRVLREPVDERGDRHWDKLDVFDPANTRVVKQISLDDKIAFWQKVFNYAEDHGIEIYVFTGTSTRSALKTNTASPTTAITRRRLPTSATAQPDSSRPIPRSTASVWRPESISISQRENGRSGYGGPMAWESWITTRTTRIFKLVSSFAVWRPTADTIMDTFKDYDAGPFHTDHKYARARVHSTTTSPYLDFEYRGRP